MNKNLYDPQKDGTGEFCCPLCLHWHDTREEKNRCLIEKHGFTILEINPTKEMIDIAIKNNMSSLKEVAEGFKNLAIRIRNLK